MLTNTLSFAALLGRCAAQAPQGAARVATRLASSSAASSGGGASPPNPAGSKKSSITEPSYFYPPPGSSLREPLYISLSDPVYFYDSGKTSLSDAYNPAPGSRSQSRSQSQSPSQNGSVPQQSRLPLVALMGPGNAQQQTQKQQQARRAHPYKLVDDLAQQPYVIAGPRNSMREPHYVSMSEPAYIPTDKK